MALKTYIEMDLFQIIFLLFIGVIVLIALLFASEHYIAAWIIIALVVGVGYLIFKFFAWSLEHAFRNKYPLDYLMNIGWVVKKFEEAGFERGEYIQPGSDSPGISMDKNNVKVSITLNANNHPYKIECIDANGNKLFAVSEEHTGTSEQIVNDVIKSLRKSSILRI